MRYLFISALIITFISCEKTKLAQKIEIDPTGKALLKVGYFSPYSTPNNFLIQLKIDTMRVSNLFNYSNVYPGGGFNTGGSGFPDYYAIDPGSRVIKISVPFAGTKNDSLVIFSGTVNLTADTRQTVIITDTAANIQATLITDDVSDPSPTMARAKFFNGIPNSGPLDLYITTTTGVIITAATGINYKQVSSYFEFPANLGAVNFQVVKTGLPLLPANVIAAYGTLPTAAAVGRNYTVLTRGYILTPVSTTDTKRPQVSVILNK